MAKAIRYVYSARTDVGRERSHNEDGIVAFHFDSIADSKVETYGFFAVSDGMGGHNAGEIASMTAIKSMVGVVNRRFFEKITRSHSFQLPDHVFNYHFKKDKSKTRFPLADTVLRVAVKKANEDIIHLSRKNPAFFGMGATVTAALLHGASLTFVNVGDSRCYLVRKGAIAQLTQDHTVVNQLMEMGKITQEEARTHPAKNFLYRSLGSEEEVVPDVRSASLEAPSTLLLCSDGLSNMVPDHAILEVASHCHDPHAATRKLIDMANKAGGRDNISVVLVKVVR